MAETSWRDKAACKGVNGEVFFTSAAGRLGGIENDRARVICMRCPVRQACLEWAIDKGEDWGVWGGHTADERRYIKRRRAREAQPVEVSA